MSPFILGLLMCLARDGGVASPGQPVWSNTEFGPGQLLAASPNGKELFTAHRLFAIDQLPQPLICRWELATGKLLGKIELPAVGIKDPGSFKPVCRVRADASPDAGTLVISWKIPNSTTPENFVGFQHARLFDLRTGAPRGETIQDITVLRSGIFAEESGSCFSADGRWFSVGIGPRIGARLDVYACRTGKREFTVTSENPREMLYHPAISRNGTRVGVFFPGEDGKLARLKLYTLPGGALVKEVPVPAKKGYLWTGVHPGPGATLYLSAMEYRPVREARSDGGPVEEMVPLLESRFFALDTSADDPGTTLREVPHLRSQPAPHMAGTAMASPSLDWDEGAAWFVSLTRRPVEAEYVQTSYGRDVSYDCVRSVKLVDTKTGKTLAEKGGLPTSCLVTADGKYVAAIGAAPGLAEGVYVWRLR